MGYVRYKLSPETHHMLKKLCVHLGMKESEISRIALFEYMRLLGILSEGAQKHRPLITRFERFKESLPDRLQPRQKRSAPQK